MPRTLKSAGCTTKPCFSITTRLISLVSAAIVSGILIWFCHQLKTDGFKIPWTFLIIPVASFLTLISHLLSLLITCCYTRNNVKATIFTLIINVPTVVIWVFGLCLLSWNILGTLAHSCTLENWGSNEGVMICQTYKVLYAFVVGGTVSHIGVVLLDIQQRRTHTSKGVYDMMVEDKTGQEMRMDRLSSGKETPGFNVKELGAAPVRVEEEREGEQYRDEIPGWRPGVNARNTGISSAQQQDYRNDRSQSVRMDHFGYQAPTQHPDIDSGYHHEYDTRRRYYS